MKEGRRFGRGSGDCWCAIVRSGGLEYVDGLLLLIKQKVRVPVAPLVNCPVVQLSSQEYTPQGLTEQHSEIGTLPFFNTWKAHGWIAHTRQDKVLFGAGGVSRGSRLGSFEVATGGRLI